jgi:hypothetical protein
MTLNYASYGAMRLKKPKRECVSRSYDIGMNLAKPKYSFDLKNLRRGTCIPCALLSIFLTEIKAEQIETVTGRYLCLI